MPPRRGSKRSRKQAASSDEAAASTEEERGEETETEEPPKKRGRGRAKKTSVSTTVARRRSSRRQSKKAAEEAPVEDAASDNTSTDTEPSATATRKTRSSRRAKKTTDASSAAAASPDIEMTDASTTNSNSTTKKRGTKKSLTKGQLEKENENLKDELEFLKTKLSEAESSLQKSYQIPALIDADDLDAQKMAEWEKTLTEDDIAREILSKNSPAMIEVSIDQETFDKFKDKLDDHGKRADEWNDSLTELTEKVAQINESETVLDSDPRSLFADGKGDPGEEMIEETQASIDLVNKHANNLELLRSVGGDLLSAREFFNTNHLSLDSLEQEAKDARDKKMIELETVKSNRSAKLIEFTQSFDALKELISKQNALEIAQYKLNNAVVNIDSLKSKFQSGMDAYNQVIQRYSSYENLAKDSIPVIENSVTKKWKIFKSLWFEWKLEDIYHYLCHTFDWFKYTIGASNKSHKKFISELSVQNVNDGRNLQLLCDVTVLINLGFIDKNHREQIAAHIGQMMQQYPFVEPEQKVDDSQNQEASVTDLTSDPASDPAPQVKSELEQAPSVEMDLSDEMVTDSTNQNSNAQPPIAVGFDDDDE